MTNTTLRLIDRLSQLVDQNKYLILSGGIGVGKTYLACAVAENCALPQYNAQGSPPPGRGYEVVSEMVPIHPSYSYENFVAGVAVSTRNGKAVFRCEDKIFLSMLHRAEQSWSRRDGKKYFLILDDIVRGEISEILGDMLSLIEPHGASGRRIPPNMYIIATKSDVTQPVRPLHYGFFRHFYEYPLENDYKYMAETPAGTYSDFDMSAQALYFRARRIVLENLRGGFSASRRERLVERFLDEQCRQLFPRILEEVYPPFRELGVAFPALRLRRMKSRWGSCLVGKGVVTLNKGLLAAPRGCIEYVAVHELCHFLHPDHSQEFYQLLSRMMPDWKARRELLNRGVPGAGS